MTKIKSESIQDFSSYGIDIENELSSMLSEEIAKSIYAESMKHYRKEKTKKVLDKIQQMKEKGI